MKKKKIDWFKQLSSRAKAEILSGLLHTVLEHMPKSTSKFTQKHRRQMTLALSDCSILANDMTAVDFRRLRKYYQDLEDRT